MHRKFADSLPTDSSMWLNNTLQSWHDFCSNADSAGQHQHHKPVILNPNKDPKPYTLYLKSVDFMVQLSA